MSESANCGIKFLENRHFAYKIEMLGILLKR